MMFMAIMEGLVVVIAIEVVVMGAVFLYEDMKQAARKR
jgi:hypothetical protein